MKNELYFERIITIGKLYLEHIFLEFETEPVFFTCVDDRDKLYLCLCSDIRGGQKWVISECTLKTLRMLISGTIDMSSALCIPEHLVLVNRDLQGHEKSCMINTCDVDPLDLPLAGTLLKCDVESADHYLMDKEYAVSMIHIECISSDNDFENRLTSYITRLNQMFVQKSELVETDTLSISEYELHTRRTDYRDLDVFSSKLYLSAA